MTKNLIQIKNLVVLTFAMSISALAFPGVDTKNHQIETEQDKNYSVLLKDGEKFNCSRMPGNSVRKANNKKITLINGAIPQCGAFNCGQVKEGSNTYQVLMISDSSSKTIKSPKLFYVNNKNFKPKTIRTISTNNTKLPILDNSKEIAANSQPTTSPYKTFLKSIFPKDFPDSYVDEYLILKDVALYNYLNSSKEFCEDVNESLANFIESKNNFMMKIANIELVEFISVLADGSLVGSYIDPLKAASLGCLYGETYLDKKAASNLNFIKKDIKPEFTVEHTITMAKAKELFKKAKGMQDIAWGFKKDGCYARAHLMARRFEAEGVRVDKVWINGTLYIPGTDLEWNFHVAPVVYVKDKNDQIQKIVIDPSLFDSPVTVEEWDKKIAKKEAKGSVISVFPFPENAALMERSTISFSSSDPYFPRDSINLTENEKMNKAKDTMEEYLEYEKEILNDN